MKLTQKAVDAIGLEADRVVWDDDTPGLGFRVQSGKRRGLFVTACRRNGRSLCPAAAAEAGTDTGGRDPHGCRARSRCDCRWASGRYCGQQRAATARARSLGKLVERYLPDAEKRLRPASLRVATLYLTKHWSTLHERPADGLTRREIMEVLER